MVAPFWDRVLVSSVSSARVMGGQGRGRSEDPPPGEEKRKNERQDLFCRTHDKMDVTRKKSNKTQYKRIKTKIICIKPLTAHQD